jgi:hypothetical protein
MLLFANLYLIVMYLEFIEHVLTDDNVVTECSHVYVLMGRVVAMLLDLFFLKRSYTFDSALATLTTEHHRLTALVSIGSYCHLNYIVSLN